MTKLAQVDPFSFIGSVTSPLKGKYTNVNEGLVYFISNVIKLLTIAAGLWALVNFLLAGLQFISSSGDEKKVASSWQKIYNSIIGLVVIAVAYVLVALLSYILFGDPTLIISPKLYGPGIQ